MAKWNAGVGLQLTIDYDDIEADTEAEAIQIAKERALEDIEWNNCDCDASNPIVFMCVVTLFIIIELMEICDRKDGVVSGARPFTCRKKRHVSGLRLRM